MFARSAVRNKLLIWICIFEWPTRRPCLSASYSKEQQSPTLSLASSAPICPSSRNNNRGGKNPLFPVWPWDPAGSSIRKPLAGIRADACLSVSSALKAQILLAVTVGKAESAAGDAGWIQSCKSSSWQGGWCMCRLGAAESRRGL